MLQPLQSLEEIEYFIQGNKLSFIYVSREDCSVCHGLLPQVEQVLKKYPKIKTGIIDADQVPEFSGQYTVFAVPVLLLFVDGREYLREARIVPMQQFDEKIKRIYENVVNS